jgi:8-oxo-dGTP diphosphatase
MSIPTKLRFKMIASSYLIYIHNQQILLSRRLNTGYEDGNYSLPAGHVEAGETLTQALIREVKEEIGVKVKPKDVNLVHTMHRIHQDIRLDFFFMINKFSGKIKNCEPKKCDDLRFFPIDKLPENTIPYIRSAIAQILKKQIYSEFGW